MKPYIRNTVFAALSLMSASCCTPISEPQVIGSMPDSEQGYSLGVSACYATTANGSILLAGGCNFPEAPAAEGGKKRYYKGIYIATATSPLQWKAMGELPEASAYGVSLQYGEKLIIAGGMNENGATASVYMLSHKDGNCTAESLPPLPCTIDNASGAVQGSRIYIAGGNDDGKASARLFMLDMENREAGWTECSPFPGNGRVQPVCAATAKNIYLWGGFTPKDSTTEAKVHTDGFKYDCSKDCWTPLPDITDENGTPLTLSGGTATAYNGTLIVAAGGVNGTIFEDAISGTYSCIPQKEYMKQPAEWYRFNNRLMVFDTVSEQWSIVQQNSLYARAGALLATDGNALYYIGGELKPGIRTPQIVRIESIK